MNEVPCRICGHLVNSGMVVYESRCPNCNIRRPALSKSENTKNEVKMTIIAIFGVIIVGVFFFQVLPYVMDQLGYE
jgi:DNA-directed RNA polymerase subunit RPC12/RpoP